MSHFSLKFWRRDKQQPPEIDFGSTRRSHSTAKMERKETTVKTEIKDGKKIVTTTTVVTTDLNPLNMAELQNALTDFDGPLSLPVSGASNPDSKSRGLPEGKLHLFKRNPDTDVSLSAEEVIAPKTKKTKTAFQKEALERHNYYRALHGVPPLQWCSKSAAKAQKHADHLASTQSFEHSHDKGWGENLYTSMNSRGPVISANAAVDSWYEEIHQMKNYSDRSPANFSEVGHFTQVVWKDSTHVGMAYAVTGNYVYVVANYLPPGNILGKFADNVFPPQE